MKRICEYCKDNKNCSYLKSSITYKCPSVQDYDLGYEAAIDKACEVYRQELADIIGIFNKFGKDLFNINELGELISLEGSFKDFCKAIGKEY